MSQINYHTLFDNSTGHESLLNNITLSVENKDMLREARLKVRAHFSNHLTGKTVKINENNIPLPKPLFYTQGSWAYKTLNSPNRPPKQQADLDDGVYFPLSYAQTQPPNEMCDFLIKSTEDLLEQLAIKEKWKFIKKNPNCSRLEIDSDKHIDVPVYSIPDIEFNELANARALTLNREYAELNENNEIDDDWSFMPREGVMLANKEDGWIYSDPRPLKDWVDSRVERKGEQLRRVIRYIKAWRDQETWSNSEPKSLLLMIAVEKCFDMQVQGRDDVCMLNVTKLMPEVLSGEVLNPIDGNDLSSSLDNDGIRNELCEKLNQLHHDLKHAIHQCNDPKEGCELLRKHFGNRFPNSPLRVSYSTIQTTKANKTSAAPLVGTNISG